WRILPFPRLAAFNAQLGAHVVTGQRQMAGDADGGDAWERGNALQDSFVELGALRIVAVARGERDPRRQQVFGPLARLDIEQFCEAADEQPRANQQHDRQRDLDYHQRAAQASPVYTAAASAFFE